jgi:hypothetical protein
MRSEPVEVDRAGQVLHLNGLDELGVRGVLDDPVLLAIALSSAAY